LVPYTVSWFVVVYVQDWLPAPVQSLSWVCAPLAVLELGTSRHRPDWPPTMRVGVPTTAAAAASWVVVTATPVRIRLSAAAGMKQRRRR
jgi:hypothetical protein